MSQIGYGQTFYGGGLNYGADVSSPTSNGTIFIDGGAPVVLNNDLAVGSEGTMIIGTDHLGDIHKGPGSNKILTVGAGGILKAFGKIFNIKISTIYKMIIKD